MKHQCNKSANGTQWSICTVCNGRIDRAVKARIVEPMNTVAKAANLAGTQFALTREGSTWGVWKCCANYNGSVRGGISYSWRYCERNMTEEAARALYARRLKGKQK